MIERRRVKIAMDELLTTVSQSPYQLVPFDLATFREMINVRGNLELHDRVIAATALLYGAKVVTRDPELAAVVSTVW